MSTFSITKDRVPHKRFKWRTSNVCCETLFGVNSIETSTRTVAFLIAAIYFYFSSSQEYKLMNIDKYSRSI